jgi:hypothetical protein
MNALVVEPRSFICVLLLSRFGWHDLLCTVPVRVVHAEHQILSQYHLLIIL